jgi:hypothetical protein
MANDTVYIRNNRPNRVVLQYAGLRVVLERRGSREDTASFPSDALTDPTIARWLRANRVEQITKEQFFDLSSRTDAFDPNYREVERREDGRVKRSLEPELVSDAYDVEVPMSPLSSTTPTIIDTDRIDKNLLTPRVQYKDEPEPTPKSVNAEETDVHDLHRGDRPVKEAPEDTVANENVAPVKKVPAKKKAAGRPKTKK